MNLYLMSYTASSGEVLKHSKPIILKAENIGEAELTITPFGRKLQLTLNSL